MRKLTIATLLLAACGAKNEDKAAPAPTPPTEERTPPTSAPTEAPNPAEPAPGAAPDFTDGYCHVSGSGAVTFDQKSPHTGSGVLVVMQWHTEQRRKTLGFPAEGLILNCLGKDARLNILSKTDKTQFPMQAATYEIGKNGGITIMGSVAHEGTKNGLAILVQSGTLEITEFDDKHIAGKGTATAKTVPDKGEVKLAFDFDMRCRGLSGCPN